MSEFNEPIGSETPKGVSRRTVTKAMAWAVPVIAVSAAVPAYAASKGGVAQLTKALANEWAKHRINVNAIAPGYMRTANTAALQADETRNRQILERIPAGRLGEPEDLAGAAVFLSSSASDYINGHVLVVDGGWLAR